MIAWRGGGSRADAPGGAEWEKGEAGVLLGSVVCLKVVWNSSASSPSAQAVLPHAQPLVWAGSPFQVLMQVVSLCGTHTEHFPSCFS